MDSLPATPVVNGFRLDGVTDPPIGAGIWKYSVATSDINADGVGDLFIGDPQANLQAGYPYVGFGGPYASGVFRQKDGVTPWPATQALATGGSLIKALLPTHWVTLGRFLHFRPHAREDLEAE